ncbi:uncharacterized protein METZ01_LOCUS101660, partial [marine metagenome]
VYESLPSGNDDAKDRLQCSVRAPFLFVYNDTLSAEIGDLQPITVNFNQA